MTLTPGMSVIGGSVTSGRGGDGAAELSVIAVTVTAAPPANDDFLTSLRIRFDRCLAIARPLGSSQQGVGECNRFS